MRLVWIAILAVSVACSSTTSTSEEPTTTTTAPPPALASDLAQGWTLTAELEGFPYTLVANEETAVAIVNRGLVDRSEGAAFWSSDGVSWGTASSSPATPTNSDVFVDGGSRGFVAVSSYGSSPVFSHSTDGVDWEAIDASTLPSVPIIRFDAVVARSEGFVITGRAADTFASFAWFSADGRAWVETKIPPIEGPIAIGANESVWMAVSAADEAGFSDEAESSPVTIFTSEDGLNWAPLETQSAPPAQTVARAFVSSLLVGDGDTWVLAVSGHAPPGLWVSTDGGTNWNEALSAHDSSKLEKTDVFLSLEGTGEGFVVLGSLNATDGDFLLFSTDGIEWTRAPTDVRFRDLATLDGRLMAVDWDGNAYVWDGMQSPG